MYWMDLPLTFLLNWDFVLGFVVRIGISIAKGWILCRADSVEDVKFAKMLYYCI